LKGPGLNMFLEERAAPRHPASSLKIQKGKRVGTENGSREELGWDLFKRRKEREKRSTYPTIKRVKNGGHIDQKKKGKGVEEIYITKWFQRDGERWERTCQESVGEDGHSSRELRLSVRPNLRERNEEVKVPIGIG